MIVRGSGGTCPESIKNWCPSIDCRRRCSLTRVPFPPDQIMLFCFSRRVLLGLLQLSLSAMLVSCPQNPKFWLVNLSKEEAVIGSKLRVSQSSLMPGQRLKVSGMAMVHPFSLHFSDKSLQFAGIPSRLLQMHPPPWDLMQAEDSFMWVLCDDRAIYAGIWQADKGIHLINPQPEGLPMVGVRVNPPH